MHAGGVDRQCGGKSVQISIMQRFCFWAAGANKHYLENCPATEHFKYECIGALVCLTAGIAAISMFFAVTITWEQDNWYDVVAYALPVSLVWSAFIFNVDRLVVMGIRPEETIWPSLIRAFPRLCLAVIIGVIISRPIELKVFEKEIKKSLTEEYIKKQGEIDSKKRERLKTLDMEAAAPYQRQLDDLQTAIKPLEDKIAEKRLQVDALAKSVGYLADEVGKEFDGTGGSREKGAGPIYREKKENLQKTELLLKETKAELDDLTKEYQRINASKQDILNNVTTRALVERPADKELAEIRARGELEMAQRGFHDYNKALWKFASVWETIAIMLFFIMVEATPVLMKVLVPPGPYDEYLRLERLRTQAEQLNLLEAVARTLKVFLKEYEATHKQVYEKIFGSIRREFDNVLKGKPAVIRKAIWQQIEGWINAVIGKLSGRPEYSFPGHSTSYTALDDPPQLDIFKTRGVMPGAFVLFITCFIVVLGCGLGLPSIYPIPYDTSVNWAIGLCGPITAIGTFIIEDGRRDDR